MSDISRPIDEVIAQARSLIAECNGVWKEVPAVALANLMLRDGERILAAAARGTTEYRERPGLGTLQEYRMPSAYVQIPTWTSDGTRIVPTAPEEQCARLDP